MQGGGEEKIVRGDMSPKFIEAAADHENIHLMIPRNIGGFTKKVEEAPTETCTAKGSTDSCSDCIDV